MLCIYDVYIVIDIEQMLITNAHLKEPFNGMQIRSFDDLSHFLEIFFDKGSCPFSRDFEYEGKYYFFMSHTFDNIVILTIQNIDKIKNILLEKKDILFDGLTKCYLKKEIELFIEQALENFVRYKKEKFSILMFDIDFFKKVNDTYGHLAGDFILKELASLVKGSLRKADIFGRFGGEEFLILLPNTNASGALKLATKLNKLAKEHAFVYNETTISITISLGITSVSFTDSYHSIVQRCDEALYKAKENGRDRVEYT